MTIQLSPRTARAYGQSKANLQKALALNAAGVVFIDPAIIKPVRGGSFTGADMQPGESFPVVMDPDRRMRFATVKRREDGTYHVG